MLNKADVSFLFSEEVGFNQRNEQARAAIMHHPGTMQGYVAQYGVS